MPTCFAASVCPKDTLRVDKNLMKVVVDATVCGDCPAPCLNFCDSAALKYAPTLEELNILQLELDGVLNAEQVAEQRKALAEQQKAAEAAEKEEEALAALAPMHLTTENFVQEVAQSELPVLVDFWAEWCGPCKQIAPIIEQLARDFAGVVKFGKLNVDEEPQVWAQIAGSLGLQSIPTLVIFFGGQIADVIVGAVPKEQLRARLQRVVDAIAQMQAQQQPAPAAPPPANTAPARLPAQPQAKQTTPAPRPAGTKSNIVRPTFGGPPRRPRR
jgi:thioredoxin 1